MNQPPTCPICKKRFVGNDVCNSEFFPFCSERCRHVDFFRWSEGKYAIVEPLTELPEDITLERLSTDTADEPNSAQ